MSVKLPNIAAEDVEIPSAGQIVLFADASNSDHISVIDSEGLVYDLTRANTCVYKTADQSVSGSSFVDISDLNFTMEAYGVYSIKAWIRVTSSIGRLYISSNGPAAPDSINFKYLSGTTWNQWTSYDQNPGFLQTGGVFYEMYIQNGPNAGTFSMRVGTVVGTDTIHKGSYLEFKKICTLS